MLIIHLKMTGDLGMVGGQAAPDPSARTIVHFDDGSHLRFSDARKLGRVYLVGRVEEVTGPLGPEPLDRNFTAARLGGMLRERLRSFTSPRQAKTPPGKWLDAEPSHGNIMCRLA